MRNVQPAITSSAPLKKPRITKMDKHCIAGGMVLSVAFMADGLMDKHGPVGFLLIAIAVLAGATLIEWRCKGAKGETDRR